MSQLTFGLTMLAVGMSGTLLTLWLLMLLIRGITAVFPPDNGEGEGKKD